LTDFNHFRTAAIGNERGQLGIHLLTYYRNSALLTTSS